GELIGVTVALRQGAKGVAFAIGSERVKQALTKHLSALKVAGVSHGLTCREKVEPEGKNRQRVVVAAGGEGAPAGPAGIQRGDEIGQGGKYPVSNRFDVERAFWDSKPGQKVELRVVRQSKPLTVVLTLAGRETGEKVTTR